ncbi:MAG TPA: glycosyltransferase [Vicinamibacterales bacterium]|nr:glycosyltransferase [Vicinamibacterales bacterium]
MPQLKLSVILPTFDRAPSLERAIAALLRQSAPPETYEVIVVDNNSTDRTAEVVTAFADRRVRLIREPRQGLSFARNAGLAASGAPVVAFTDDDVEVAPDWVETIVSTLARHPGVDGIGGRVLPAWENGRPRWLTREHWAPLALQDHGDSRRVFDRATPIGLIGANVAFRRTVFDRVGTFSPSVQRVKDGIGSTEDHELLARVYDSGGRMLYQPKLLVMTRVPGDRCNRRYHRRWHEGHGRFYALMRLPEMERARVTPFGVPGHLLRDAAQTLAAWTRSALVADWDRAFLAELRLRFLKGFVWTRLAR